MKSSLKGPAIAAVMVSMFAAGTAAVGHVSHQGSQVTLADSSCKGSCKGGDKKKAPKEPKEPKAPEFASKFG